MSYKFIEVMRNITTGFSPGTKFIARFFRSGNIEPKTAVERIARHSQQSRGVVLGVLAGLEDLLKESAADGEAVMLPYVGSFIPGIEANAMDTVEEVDASTIRRYKMKFFPSVELKQEITKTSPTKLSLNIKGLEIPEGGALTQEQFDKLQKEYLSKGGSSLGIDISED